jgi:hypothetical protein
MYWSSCQRGHIAYIILSFAVWNVGTWQTGANSVKFFALPGEPGRVSWNGSYRLDSAALNKIDARGSERGCKRIYAS